MLAGNMKLNHFLAIAAVAVAAGAGILYVSCDGGSKPAPTASTATPDTATAKSPVAPDKPAATDSPAAAPKPAVVGPSERPVDVAVMQWRGKNLGSSKLKDASKGQPFKVSVYQDSGEKTVNRVKVDLNRNGKWDEKWTFDGDKIKRKVAPKDDEVYSESYKWADGAWKKK